MPERSDLVVTSNPTHDQVLDALHDMASDGLRLPVRGQCMEPVLTDGCTVELRRARLYWPGDIVAFRYFDGSLRIHRVLGYRPRRNALDLWTRGDAAAAADAPIPVSRVIGRVVGRDGIVDGRPVGWHDRARALGGFFALAARRLSASRNRQ